MENKSGKAEVVVITGASAGVGRATVREFARKRVKLALISRGEEGLKAAQKEAIELGSDAKIYRADVADPHQIETVAEKIEQELGPIDIWINNAMNSVFSPVREMRPEEYKRVTEVTYLGQVYGTLAALKRMLPRDKGKIIFVGSALAYRGIPLQSAYCASKHAVEGFFNSLRSELLHDKSNVKVSMIQLPAMNTPQFSWVKSRLPFKPKPMGKIFQPEVAAKAIVYLSEHDRREMYVGLPTVEAILGEKFIPGFMDKWLGRKGYKGQQTDEPEDPNRKDNVWEPVPGDHGAHGNFDREAHTFSSQTWLNIHRKEVGLSLAAIGLGVAAAKIMEKRREKKFKRKRALPQNYLAC